MIYLALIIYLIALRIIELFVAHSNEKYQKEHGAFEVQDPYYRHIVMTHTLFFVVLIAESYVVHQWEQRLPIFIFGVFLLLQIFRFWCLISLGRYWNTKVIVQPNSNLIVKGPYRWIKHPNYIVVGLEFLVIPIMFKAYMTGVIFFSLHLWLMNKRIPLENSALEQYLVDKS
ncbi:isoprenylcysteine carboxyl methyltransferase family protein [Tenuibacillus multivorans]|uniref:Methyltransferase n=1 Tax=Tenuibacillus multivorans TaxID=237069 RepID=A0A1H0CR41_9BACI|nr:isoprenylcysteine carboxylmethyltransferase family protein [Tenuibacillus multivorans]GEL76197.1 hypothetical protein TMU01_04320 [Tenuibacillus multivorans]SDN60316.1 methyltransferase [Tenuibacillus multivorans]